MEEQTSFLGKQKVGKLIFKLAIPTIIAQIVNLLYNIVDRIYIGHIPEVGKTALTGGGFHPGQSANRCRRASAPWQDGSTCHADEATDIEAAPAVPVGVPHASEHAGQRYPRSVLYDR